MKKIIYASVLLSFFFFVNLATANDISEQDGNDWNGYSETAKVFFVSGFMMGSAYIVTETYLQSPKEFDINKAYSLASKIYNSDKKLKKTQNITFTKEEIILWGNYRSEIRNNTLFPYGLYKITVGQIKSGLDVLYKDFRNVRITIPDAIYVVKKQIEGLSNEDTEALLLYLRGGKANTDLLFIKDSEGKFVKYISFP